MLTRRPRCSKTPRRIKPRFVRWVGAFDANALLVVVGQAAATPLMARARATALYHNLTNLLARELKAIDGMRSGAPQSAEGARLFRHPRGVQQQPPRHWRAAGERRIASREERARHRLTPPSRSTTPRPRPRRGSGRGISGLCRPYRLTGQGCCWCGGAVGMMIVATASIIIRIM